MQNDENLPSLSFVEKLRIEHNTGPFNCGKPALNYFLKRYALGNQRANATRTYVVHRANKVVGYYSLAVGSVAYQEAPERIITGLAHHPVPLMILARLAVDTSEQGRGLGSALLKDAMLRTFQAAEIAGVRALVVHAKDEEAKGFYEHFNLKPSPTDPYHLYCLMKDIRRLLGTYHSP